MAFVKIAKIGDISSGTTKAFEVGDRVVVLCNVQGEYFAVDDVCTHDEGSIWDGILDGCEIECPRHGARFDVRTGEVKALPAVVPVDVFTVRVEGDDIEVEI